MCMQHPTWSECQSAKVVPAYSATVSAPGVGGWGVTTRAAAAAAAGMVWALFELATGGGNALQAWDGGIFTEVCRSILVLVVSDSIL